MSKVVCPTCGTNFSEDSTDEAAEAEFAEAMEWYFNRDETDEWTEFQEWRSKFKGDTSQKAQQDLA